MKKIFMKFHFENAIQTVILFTTAYIFHYAVNSKKALMYVHARHIGMIIFAEVIFIMIGLFKTQEAFFFTAHNHSEKRKIPVYLIVFIIPIVLAFSIPHKVLTSDSLAFGGDVLSFQKQDTPNGSISGFSFKNNRLLELQDGFIVMDDNTFGRWLPELYLNLDSWLNKKIKIEGAVWKNPEVLTEYEFAIGRMLMVCCAADMQPTGIIAHWKETDKLNEDDWVRVIGTISKTEYEGEHEPFILVESVEVIPRPELEYVYPF